MSSHSTRPGTLRISGTGLPGGTTLELDGHDIATTVTDLSLHMGVGRLPTATLNVSLHDLSTEVEDTRIVIPDDTRALLVRLGWTPPEGDGR